jgi:hypothetical protein
MSLGSANLLELDFGFAPFRFGDRKIPIFRDAYVAFTAKTAARYVP